MSRTHGNWMSTELRDAVGRPFFVGDHVARGIISGRSANIEITKVSKIENGKLYLDGSNVAIRYPGRLLIVNAVLATAPNMNSDIPFG